MQQSGLNVIYLLDTTLGQTFQSFDDKCEAYGVTKIKVIGDAYMAITG
jgi:class 3 adenylate cyclase